MDFFEYCQANIEFFFLAIRMIRIGSVFSLKKLDNNQNVEEIKNA